MVGPVKGHQAWLIVDDGVQMDRPPPNCPHIAQGVGGLVQLQVNPLVIVLEQQFAAVAVVGVGHVNPRLPEVRQSEEQPLFDLLELAGLNDVIAPLFIVREGKDLMFLTKLWRQEGVDKRDIVMDLAHLEDFLPAQA